MSSSRTGSSRLERMIERLTTQRACIDFAAQRIADLPGSVLEVGLGKGRTYDYLRRSLPQRQIFVFDRDIHAPKDCVPDAEHLFLGDFRTTLSAGAALGVTPVALIHADIGSENSEHDRALASAVAPLLAALAQPGTLILTDRAMASPGWRQLPLPAGSGNWTYYIYCVPESGAR